MKKICNKKSLISVIISFLAMVIFAFAIYIAVGATVAKKNNATYDYFGYSLHVVTTDSMSPDYNVQDMVFIKKCYIENVKVGDDVLYKSNNPKLNGGNILHRVVSVENINGQTVLTTQGIAEGVKIDPEQVTEIIGVAKGNNQALGKIYLMLTTPGGWIAMAMLSGGIVLVTKCISNIIKSCKKSDENEF